MKSYKIEIYGDGAELVVGNLTKKQVNTINKSIDENDLDSVSHFFDDEELLAKHKIPYWHQIDNLYHKYGPYYFNSTIKVTDHDENVILDSECVEIESSEFEEKVFNFDKKPLVFSVAQDSGLCFSTTIELDDNDEFDINKLTILVDEVIVEAEYIIISKILYDGEELYSEGEDTDGELFEINIYD